MPATIDELIHQPLRLKIMAALHGEPAGEPLEFTRLKAIAGATDCNLGSHLMTLEKAGYVESLKDFVGRRPRTRVQATSKGRAAFRGHLAYLRELIDAAEAGGKG